jgi:hypothetical protein
MTPLRLVVLGMMGRMPFGGQTWLYAHWLRGLADAGHEVWYVEDDSVWPYDPIAQRTTDDCSYAVRHVAGTLERIGLAGRWAFRLDGRADACWGLSPVALDELYRSCDALLNVVGATDLREAHLQAPFRVYIQTDPVTAELRLDNGDEHTAVAFGNHHVIATYGENYGADDCGVPIDSRRYVKTRQPVDLGCWPAIDGAAPDFTTVGNYRHDGEDVEWRGDVYRWSKHHEWEKFVDLPSRTAQPFRVALYVRRDDDLALLERHGWRIVSPHDMSLDVFGAYRRFIQGSRGEFTVAKDQNVRLRSGWFSERDACYLASGRPVVAQDTGFGCALPTGEGLFAVSCVEEAAEAVEAINADYPRHARAARAVAEEHFEARGVAERLLADVGLT